MTTATTMGIDPKTELQNLVTALQAATGKDMMEIVTQLKTLGGDHIEAARAWLEDTQNEETASTEVMPIAPVTNEIKTVGFADGLQQMREAVAYSGMTYLSLKKIQEFQAANASFALKATGEGFLHKISRFPRVVKVNGVVQYEKDEAGNVIYQLNANGVSVPKEKAEFPEEIYLPLEDRDGNKFLLNMNWGFQKEFPAFCDANGLVFFRASASGSTATKNYKVSIVVA